MSYGQRKIKIQGEIIEVDRCIADELIELNMRGIKTLASCCGHEKGERDGYIIVADEHEQTMIEHGYEIVGTYKSLYLDPLREYHGFRAHSVCKGRC